MSDLRDALHEAAPEADAGEGRTLILPEPAIVEQGRATASWRQRLVQRAVAGGTAGIAAAAAIAAAHAPPVHAPLAGAAVGLAVALLPRLAWLGAAIAGVAWLAAGPPHEPGTALVVAAGLAASPLLLPRTGWLWSVPGAGARARGGRPRRDVAGARRTGDRRAWRRAAIAALGAWWIALAELLAGRDLFLGRASGTAAPAAWAGSADDAMRNALGRWAARVRLPCSPCGRSPRPCCRTRCGAARPCRWCSARIGWAAGSWSGPGLLAGALRGLLAHPDARGALGGALAGAALAAGLSLLRARRRAAAIALVITSMAPAEGPSG